MTRRELLALGVQGAGLGILPACRQGSATRPRRKNEVLLWASFESDEQRRYFERHFIGAFHEMSDVRVILVTRGRDLDRVQQVAVASGHGPDIIVTAGPSLALEFIKAGKLRRLDDYARRFQWANKLQSWAYDAGRVRGNLYSIPTSFETMLTFYNEATLSRHGWPVPRTRDDLERLCTEAAARGLMPIAAGNAEYRAATEFFVTVFLSHFAGPEAVHKALDGRLRWTEPVFVDAIRLLQSYFLKGWFGGSVQGYFTNRFDPLKSALASGKAALMFEGSWSFTTMKTFFGRAAGTEDTWNWAPPPSLADPAPQGMFCLGVGGTYSINAGSERAEASAAYLDWLLSSPARHGAALAANAFQPFPVKLTEADIPATADARIRGFYQAFAAGRTFGYTTWTYWPPKSNVYVYDAMDRVIGGKLTPEDPAELAANPVGPPSEWHWSNFVQAWEMAHMGVGFRNTAILVSGTVAGVCAIAGCASYALARLQLPGAGLVTLYLIVSSALPIQLFLVPLFHAWATLGLYDTLFGLIVVYWGVFSPFATLLLRSFMVKVPREYEEAARLDGAGEWAVFTQVTLRLSWPGFVTVALTTGLAAYNEFLLAVTFLPSDEYLPVSTSLHVFQQGFSQSIPLVSAAGLLMVLPMLLVFLLLQRRFVEGLAASGLSGGG